MSITVQQIRDELENIAQSSDLESLKEAGEKAEKRFRSLNQSSLGLDTSTSNGFRSVSVSRDHPDSDGLSPGDAICFLTENVSGLEAELKSTVSTGDKTALDAIVGSGGAVSDGFLKETVSGSSPRALKRALQDATGKDPAELTDAITRVLPEDLRGEAKEAIRAGLDTAEKLGKELEKTVKEVQKKIQAQQGDLTPNVMENITLALDGTVINELSSLTGGKINDNDLKDVLTNLSSLTENSISSAIETVSKLSGLPLDDVESRVRAIDTSVAGNIRRSPFTSALGEASSVVRQVNSQTQLWEGKETEIQS